MVTGLMELMRHLDMESMPAASFQLRLIFPYLG
jgi:hypothetical protein